MTANFEIELKDSEFHRFRKLIYELAGISLSDRKRELVKARLARRLRALELDSYSAYYELLQDPQRARDEIEHFINSLTTNKTEFYREPHHFDYLKQEFLPGLRMATLSGREKKVRIWCAASSTGQEPYTLALTLYDYFSSQTDWDLRILASDIDTQVLATASAGVYPEAELDAVPSQARSKYFTRYTQGENVYYEARPELKRLISFRQINLNEPIWPINIRFDAIFCRNVMIYFDQQTQAKVVEHFSQHLAPGGLLVIGHSESLFSITDDFESLGETIYRIKPHVASRSLARDRGGKDALVVPTASTAARSASATARSASAAAQSVSGTAQSAATTAQRVAPAKPSPVASPKKSGSGDDKLAQCRHLPVIPLIVGEYQASREQCLLKTTIGSCIAACLYDATNGIGGMNHFMLPDSSMRGRVNTSYGVHAMELLINALMNLGANRRQLVAKIFGGAQVVDTLVAVSNVGARNIEFVKQFLDTERIPIVAENVGGQLGRQVHFIPSTGKVLLKLLDGATSTAIDREQQASSSRFLQSLNTQAQNSVTLFAEGHR